MSNHHIALFIMSLCVLGQTSLYAVEEDVAYNLAYRQLSYKLEDPQGDFSLATRVAMSPKAIFLTTVGKQEEFNQYLEQIDIEKQKYSSVFNPFERLMEYEIHAEQTGNDHATSTIDTIRNDRTKTKQQQQREIADYLNERQIIEGRDNPINRIGLINSLKQVMVEEYRENAIIPTRGQFHQWSKGFKATYTSDALIVLPISKLLAALAL